MDEDALPYNGGLTLLSEGLNNIANPGSVDDNCAIPYLWFGSSGVSIPFFANESKRKREIVNGSTLALGLGNSSNSCISTLSRRETDNESLGDLDLGLELVGNNMTSISEKFSYGTRNGPEVDLQLSLSTCPAESGNVHSCGKGSSTRQHGALISPLPSLEAFNVVNQINNPTRKIFDSLNISSGPVKKTREKVVAFTSDPIQQEQRLAIVKTCLYEGCIRGGRGASGLCIAHGGGRRCQRNGCQKGAEGKTVFCKAHGGGKRCQYLGCTKSAEGRTENCISHGGGRRCSHDDCTRAARGNSGLCIRHGGGKRCRIEDCIKSAEGITGLCISHGGGRRCQYLDCAKGAQGSTMFCKAHGGGRRCAYLGCTKGAEGSTSFCKSHGGGKRCTSQGCTKSVHGGTLFCVGHGGGKRCANQGCTKSARGRTDFCVRHGGGKRCQIEGCTKSAQGSTDYCKAHGGGKRCSWALPGHRFMGQDVVPCGRFARGKSGLCAFHAAHNEQSVMTIQDGSAMKAISYPTSISNGFNNCGNEHIHLHDNHVDQGSARLNEFLLSEGRVHGGSLMAMLRSSALSEAGNSVSNEHGISFSIPQ